MDQEENKIMNREIIQAFNEAKQEFRAAAEKLNSVEAKLNSYLRDNKIESENCSNDRPPVSDLPLNLLAKFEKPFPNWKKRCAEEYLFVISLHSYLEKDYKRLYKSFYYSAMTEYMCPYYITLEEMYIPVVRVQIENDKELEIVKNLVDLAMEKLKCENTEFLLRFTSMEVPNDHPDKATRLFVNIECDSLQEMVNYIFWTLQRAGFIFGKNPLYYKTPIKLYMDLFRIDPNSEVQTFDAISFFKQNSFSFGTLNLPKLSLNVIKTTK